MGKFGLVVVSELSVRFPIERSHGPAARDGSSAKRPPIARDKRKRTMKASKTNRTRASAKLAGALLGAGLILGGITWAASPAVSSVTAKSELAISLTAKKVVKQADGKEKLLAADRAFPGEVIQYDALYVNQTAKLLTSVSPTLPIPNGMIFVPNSAMPAPTEASLDGKSFQKIPILRKVTTPTGEEKEEEVPATEYRALRWQAGDLPPAPPPWSRLARDSSRQGINNHHQSSGYLPPDST
jgi:hypothetical protein